VANRVFPSFGATKMNVKRTTNPRLSLAFVLCFANCATCQVSNETPAKVELPKLAVGDPLPAFESLDHTGKIWKSTEHIGHSVVVMYFYPGDFTGGCMKQAEAYREGLENIEGNCAVVVGVSGDEVATHKIFRETFGLEHALLADTKGELANRLGIPTRTGGRVYAVTPDRKPLLDADGKRVVLERPLTLARYTLVIDRQGKLVSMREVKNPSTDIEEVVTIVKGLHK